MARAGGGEKRVAAQAALEQARLQYARARSTTLAERETFANWLAARSGPRVGTCTVRRPSSVPR